MGLVKEIKKQLVKLMFHYFLIFSNLATQIIYTFLFFFTGATTHYGFVFCSPLAVYSPLAYEVS